MEAALSTSSRFDHLRQVDSNIASGRKSLCGMHSDRSLKAVIGHSQLVTTRSSSAGIVGWNSSQLKTTRMKRRIFHGYSQITEMHFLTIQIDGRCLMSTSARFLNTVVT